MGNVGTAKNKPVKRRNPRLVIMAFRVKEVNIKYRINITIDMIVAIPCFYGIFYDEECIKCVIK